MTRRLLLRAALCLIPIASCLSIVDTGRAATNHPLLGSLTGQRIALNEEFKGACGVAVDAVGDIYVADYYHDRVLVFNKKEEFLTEIRDLNPLDSSGVAPIDGPCDLAVDPSGALYVNNYHRDVIRVRPTTYPPQSSTPYGEPETIDTTKPTGVAVDPASGDVYVDERTSIARFEAPLAAGAAPQSRIGEGTLEDGYGVAVSSFAGTAGRVYVADAAAGIVRVFGPSGDPLEGITGEGSPRSGFHSLVDSDLAVDPGDGHLYVVDNLTPFSERPEAVVYEFSPSGNYRGQLPAPKVEGEASFLRHGEPSGLAIGPGGRIYASSGNYEDAAVFVFGPAPVVATQLLTVSTTGAGSGVVASSPAALRCGSACTGEVEKGSKLTLFAIPDRGSRFVGWDGCEEQLSATSCTMTMAGDRAVTAEFEPAPQVDLAVTVTGSGSGAVYSVPSGIECGEVCAGEFDEGSVVTLSAVPGPRSRLAGWSNCDLETAEGDCRVTVTAARSVAAEFAALPDQGESNPEPSVRAAIPVPFVPEATTAPAAMRVLGTRASAGMLSLRVAVSAAGRLSVSGKTIRSRRRVVFGPGEVDLPLSLNRSGRSRLHTGPKRAIVAKVVVALTPFDGGPAVRLNRTVTFAWKGGKR